MRWFVPAVLCFLLWAFLVGVWLHDWRMMVGSVVAFVGVIAVEFMEEALDVRLADKQPVEDARPYDEIRRELGLDRPIGISHSPPHDPIVFDFRKGDVYREGHRGR